MSNSGWDEETTFDERITPLLEQITAICTEKQIPMVAVFQYAREERDDGGEGRGRYYTAAAPYDDRASSYMRQLKRFVVAQAPSDLRINGGR